MSFLLFLILYYNIPRVNYRYDKITDSYVISKAFGNIYEYSVPNYYKGKKVTKIDVRAFENSSIKYIYFEDDSNIETIERRSFYNSGLVKIEFPLSLKEINQNAFSYSKNLEEAVFKDGAICDIGASAFFECSSLNKVKLPEESLVVGTFAFFNCINLKELTLPRKASIMNEILYNVEAKVYYYSSDYLDSEWLKNSNSTAILIE